MKIVSIGFIEGFYYKPRIDMEVLEKYSDGLILLAHACRAIFTAILQGNYQKQKNCF